MLALSVETMGKEHEKYNGSRQLRAVGLMYVSLLLARCGNIFPLVQARFVRGQKAHASANMSGKCRINAKTGKLMRRFSKQNAKM